MSTLLALNLFSLNWNGKCLGPLLCSTLSVSCRPMALFGRNAPLTRKKRWYKFVSTEKCPVYINVCVHVPDLQRFNGMSTFHSVKVFPLVFRSSALSCCNRKSETLAYQKLSYIRYGRTTLKTFAHDINIHNDKQVKNSVYWELCKQNGFGKTEEMFMEIVVFLWVSTMQFCRIAHRKIVCWCMCLVGIWHFLDSLNSPKIRDIVCRTFR